MKLWCRLAWFMGGPITEGRIKGLLKLRPVHEDFEAPILPDLLACSIRSSSWWPGGHARQALTGGLRKSTTTPAPLTPQQHDIQEDAVEYGVFFM